MPVPSAAAPTAARVTAPALLRGRSHHEHAPPPTSLQRSLMLVSSLLYLCPAAAWFHFGFVKLCAAFGAVTMLSVTADSGGGILPEALMRPMRVADRTVGTLSLISSVVCNSNSILNWFLSMAAVLSALCFLTTGRALSPARRRRPPTSAAVSSLRVPYEYTRIDGNDLQAARSAQQGLR